jgi:hypothetical protein
MEDTPGAGTTIVLRPAVFEFPYFVENTHDVWPPSFAIVALGVAYLSGG